MAGRTFKGTIGAIIDIFHDEIHGGAVHMITDEVSLAQSSATAYSISVPAGEEVHLKPMQLMSQSAMVTGKLTEGSTSSAGTSATPINRNRNSTKASTLTIKKDVTVSEAGTAIDMVYAGTGGNPAVGRGGTGAGSNDEIILKSNTEYLLTFTNVGAATTTFSFALVWYEYP